MFEVLWVELEAKKKIDRQRIKEYVFGGDFLFLGIRLSRMMAWKVTWLLILRKNMKMKMIMGWIMQVLGFK